MILSLTIFLLAFVLGLLTIWFYDIIERPLKNGIIILLYIICPLIVSIIYWQEEPVQFTSDIEDVPMKYIHNIASILGIFSYIWMCFNIIIILKINMIEKNIKMSWLIKFHSHMAVIAFVLGAQHAAMLMLGGEIPEKQFITGILGLYLFLILILLAATFMTNWFINSKILWKVRSTAYKNKFKYKTNKLLHNITLLAVFFIFIHTLVSSTADVSIFMRAVYFFFFFITLMGWITHKVVRSLRPDPDPYARRKVSYDINTTEKIQKSIKDWSLEIIKEHPSLYPCIQCGTCTTNCPVSNISKGEYNPRRNILNTILGYKDALLSTELLTIWGCTLCDTCDVVCPQSIELTEVFAFLKNESVRKGDAPDAIYGQTKAVFDYGKAIPPQPAIERRRENMGLPGVITPDINEVQTLLKNIGVNEKRMIKKKKLK